MVDGFSELRHFRTGEDEEITSLMIDGIQAINIVDKYKSRYDLSDRIEWLDYALNLVTVAAGFNQPVLLCRG